MTFRFGIEHEVAFLNVEGEFADFSNTPFAVWDQMIQSLPSYVGDQACLRLGDLGIRSKRWYIEGFERFSETGAFVTCIPKGIEIRTTLHGTVAGAIAELEASFQQLLRKTDLAGFRPILTSFNPQRNQFVPQPPLNAEEQARLRASPEEQTELLAMLTYGPDLNLSQAGLSTTDLIDMGRKLTYYSPFLVPFSFSSPLGADPSWSGLSARTYHRTGLRPAVLVFVDATIDPANLPAPTTPSLVKLARTPSEVGRLEFKAFDSCGNFQLYAALLTVLKGLMLDRSLPGRAWVPDRALHQRVALDGFAHPPIAAMADHLLDTIEPLLDDSDRPHIDFLRDQRQRQHCAARVIREAIIQGQDWREVMAEGYVNGHGSVVED